MFWKLCGQCLSRPEMPESSLNEFFSIWDCFPSKGGGGESIIQTFKMQIKLFTKRPVANVIECAPFLWLQNYFAFLGKESGCQLHILTSNKKWRIAILSYHGHTLTGSFSEKKKTKNNFSWDLWRQTSCWWIVPKVNKLQSIFQVHSAA